MSEASPLSSARSRSLLTESDSLPVVLTGATGFIGRSIQRQLLNEGTPVRALVRPGSPHLDALDPRCEQILCDLTDTGRIAETIDQAAAVIYCAGSVRGRSLNDFLPANATGVKATLEAMQTQGSAAPLLLISSLAASRPELSNYAKSKQLGEAVLRQQTSVPWTIIRPPAVYGPDDTEMRPVLKMARRGLVIRPGPKQQRVSLLFADDLARAVSAWLKNWRPCTGQTFSIDDGQPGGYDWAGIVRAAGNARFRMLGIPRPVLTAAAGINYLASALLGYSPMLSPGKARELTQADWLCDNTAFIKATGWQPQIGLPSGIRLSLE